MSRHTVITDDMDGSPDAQTITFRFDGQNYEIDLSRENQEKFRQALTPYLAKSRVVAHDPAHHRDPADQPPAAGETGLESGPPAPSAGGSKLKRLRESRATSPEASPGGPPPSEPRPRR